MRAISKTAIPFCCAGLLLLAGLLACRPPRLQGGVEAAEIPASSDAPSLPASDLEAPSEADLESRRSTLEARAAHLDAREAELRQRQQQIEARERNVDRQLMSMDARLEELEAARTTSAPTDVVPTPAPPAATAPAAAADPPRVEADVIERRASTPGAFRVTLPEGTAIAVELIDPLSSRGSQVGDTFRTHVAADVVVDGEVAVAAGSVVYGRVIEAVPAKKIGGRARLGLIFSDLEPVGGRSTAIDAEFSLAGRSNTKRDAATIGGAAAGGAILGSVIDDDDAGTVIGAILGAAAGAAIASRNRREVELPDGTPFELRLSRPAYIVRNE